MEENKRIVEVDLIKHDCFNCKYFCYLKNINEWKARTLAKKHQSHEKDDANNYNNNSGCYNKRVIGSITWTDVQGRPYCVRTG